jgi:hypothetical protein
MKDIVTPLEAKPWGHAFTLQGADGVTYGRLLLGEWLEPKAAAHLARVLAAGTALLAAGEKVLADLEARIDAAPSDAKPVFNGIADLHDAINQAKIEVRS